MSAEISPIGENTPRAPMSAEEARLCIDRIKHRVEHVRVLVVELRDRRGWAALGYQSWRECVVAEFEVGQSHLYRQLQAALIEREISPNGEIGTIPEGRLRPLAALPEGSRREAWEEAVATAPDGKVTADHVRAVVARRCGNISPNGEKPADRISTNGQAPPELNGADTHQASGMSKVNGVLTPDPPDVAAARAAGRIAADVVPEVSEPAPGPEPGPEPEEPAAEPTDEEWLAALPLSAVLSDQSLRTFHSDALVYRRLEAHRRTFAHHATRAINQARRACPYAWRVRSFLKINRPEKWLRCPAAEDGGCGGTGVSPFGDCPRCHGAGYVILS